MGKITLIYAVAIVGSLALGWFGTGWMLANAPAEVVAVAVDGGR